MVMETAAPPLVTSDGNLYSTTTELKPNASNPSKNNTDDYDPPYILPGVVYVSIISSIEIPIISLAIYAVHSHIKLNHSAPVFVINLLTADLIQIVCMLLFTSPSMLTIPLITTVWASYTGFYFMTCIAVERYVLIAHPFWHRSHRSVKCFVCTSLTGWLLSLTTIPVFILTDVLLFIPFIFYAVIILCFVGSCRSLSHSISLTPLKKQIVLAPLFFVLMSYTFLILPIHILMIVCNNLNNTPCSLFRFTGVLYLLNPLVDCLLYVFMRSDAENIIRTPHCCSRLKRVQTEMGQTTSTDVQRDHV